MGRPNDASLGLVLPRAAHGRPLRQNECEYNIMCWDCRSYWRLWMNKLGSSAIALIILLISIVSISLESCTHYQNTLPKDWPVPQLSFTGDVSITRTLLQGIKPATGTTKRDRMWVVYIHCDKGKAAVLANVKAALLPLGYQSLVIGNNQMDDAADEQSRYYSPNGLISISVVMDVTRGGAASESDMQSTIDQLKAGLASGKPEDQRRLDDFISSYVDYQVTVTSSTKPDNSYSLAVSNRTNKIRLVPLTN